MIPIFFSLAVAFAGTTETLSGIVTDSLTHQPIAGATVTVFSPSPRAEPATGGYVYEHF